MCHASDYAHLLEGEPSPEERAAMAQIPQEPERRPRDVSGEPREWTPTPPTDVTTPRNEP